MKVLITGSYGKVGYEFHVTLGYEWVSTTARNTLNGSRAHRYREKCSWYWLSA